MSANPNLIKVGKRKVPAGTQQAEWLFPGAEKTTATPNASTSAPAQSKRAAKKIEKQLAEDLLKRRDAGDSTNTTPPTELVGLVCLSPALFTSIANPINQVGAFLLESGFTSASKSLAAENKTGGSAVGIVKDLPSLSTIYKEWRQLKDEKSSASTTNTKKDVKAVASKSSSTGDGDVEMADAVCVLRKYLSSR